MKRRIRLLRQEKPDSQKGDGGKKAYRPLYGKQKRKRVSFFFKLFSAVSGCSSAGIGSISCVCIKSVKSKTVHPLFSRYI